MRATDGSVWDGCPRTRLEAAIDELGDLGYSVQVALEPEFYLLRPGDGGDYQPVNTTRMFTRAGLATERVFIERVVDELRSMGVTVAQLGKEYGPGQYEMSVHHADPIRAVDDYFALKDAVRDLARDQGYVATFMPKPYAHWAGSSLHVHLSIWDADGRAGSDRFRPGRGVAFRCRKLVPWRHPGAPRRADRTWLADGQLLQALAARLLGAGQHLLGVRQPLRRGPHPRRRQAASSGVPLAGQQRPALPPAGRAPRRWRRRHPPAGHAPAPIPGRYRPPDRGGSRAIRHRLPAPNSIRGADRSGAGRGRGARPLARPRSSIF